MVYSKWNEKMLIYKVITDYYGYHNDYWLFLSDFNKMEKC